MNETLKPAFREILLAFWKIHILHHAAERPVYGQWIIEELRRHGYDISPGTLYPLLSRLERVGWLKSLKSGDRRVKARKSYRLSPEGRHVLKFVRRQVDELQREIS